MSESPRVLVIDDSLAVCHVVEKLLRKCGFTEIELVQTGAKALERLAAAQFDLVICDWEMPVMSGLEVLTCVRLRADLRDVPFVLMSAKRDRRWVAEANRLGASCMITKPFDSGMLREKMRQLGFAVKNAAPDNSMAEPSKDPTGRISAP